MKIKFFSLILAFIFCISLLLFTGCASTEESATDPKVDLPDRFVLVEYFKAETFSSAAAYVIVDTETNVCYLLVVESQGAGLTTMVDAEGKPLLWDNFDKK